MVNLTFQNVEEVTLGPIQKASMKDRQSKENIEYLVYDIFPFEMWQKFQSFLLLEKRSENLPYRNHNFKFYYATTKQKIGIFYLKNQI